MTIGVLSALDILIHLYFGSFYADKAWVFQLLLIPFATAGIYGVIREPAGASFIGQAARHYWQVLLPALVLLFAMLATALLIMVPLALAGIPSTPEALSFTVLGVAFSLAFFSFFYDTAAVFEGRGVFDSLRRSVEFTILNSWKVVQFFVICIIATFGIAFAALFVWAMLVADNLEPLTRMNATEVQTLVPGDLIALLGPTGVWITALVLMAATILIATLVPAFKACFFRRYAGTRMPVVGEYDEKGRWYKY
ncbi:MAG: hypothetical protein EHJ95_02130 [Methanobacteriota archaeon]|nr:MAG: hypothetical protein EHJ95_02130 [Euryarchaeota archaeon]